MLYIKYNQEIIQCNKEQNVPNWQSIKTYLTKLTGSLLKRI